MPSTHAELGSSLFWWFFRKYLAHSSPTASRSMVRISHLIHRLVTHFWRGQQALARVSSTVFRGFHLEQSLTELASRQSSQYWCRSNWWIHSCAIGLPGCLGSTSPVSCSTTCASAEHLLSSLLPWQTCSVSRKAHRSMSGFYSAALSLPASTYSRQLYSLTGSASHHSSTSAPQPK